MFKVGDKVEVEIESITTEKVDMFATGKTKPIKLYKLKGIPMYFSEEDFKKIINST